MRRWLTSSTSSPKQRTSTPFFSRSSSSVDEQPAFAAAEVLRVVQAEGADVADGPDLAALVLRAVGLAGILDHEELVLLRDGQDRVHVGGQPLDVHGDDGLRARGDGRLELRGIHAVRPRVDVDEDRDGVLVQGAGGGGEEGERGGDDLVPRSDAARRQGHVQGRRAAHRGEAVLCADVRRPFLLQGRRLRRRAARHDARNPAPR